ncbi:MAG: DNA polymerase IV [Tissierellia bacterium]|nr:DNA polymerase IV [Tissierellia bacterium]
MERVILHCDINSCYASIEARRNPELKRVPMAVGGHVEDRHGIILAKNQIAKKYGVKTGEPIWQADMKCPGLVIIPPDYDEYVRVSKKIQKMYTKYTDQVEPFGMDECWLDCTKSRLLFGTGREIGENIRKEVWENMGLTISVGVSYNKIFAKLGSDMRKPDALTEIRKEDYNTLVAPLPVRNLLGVGRATERKLKKIGIYTIGELGKAPLDLLLERFGKWGRLLHLYATGKEQSPVSIYGTKPPVKSVGHGITMVKDALTSEEVNMVMKELSIAVGHRMRNVGVLAGGVQISIRDGGSLHSKEYQEMISPTQSGNLLGQAAYQLFQRVHNWELHPRIRSITVRAIYLHRDSAPVQPNFLKKSELAGKLEIVDQVLYNIRDRYGEDSITMGHTLNNGFFPSQKGHNIIMPTGMIYE